MMPKFKLLMQNGINLKTESTTTWISIQERLMIMKINRICFVIFLGLKNKLNILRKKRRRKRRKRNNGRSVRKKDRKKKRNTKKERKKEKNKIKNVKLVMKSERKSKNKKEKGLLIEILTTKLLISVKHLSTIVKVWGPLTSRNTKILEPSRLENWISVNSGKNSWKVELKLLFQRRLSRTSQTKRKKSLRKNNRKKKMKTLCMV